MTSHKSEDHNFFQFENHLLVVPPTMLHILENHGMMVNGTNGQISHFFSLQYKDTYFLLIPAWDSKPGPSELKAAVLALRYTTLILMPIVYDENNIIQPISSRSGLQVVPPNSTVI